MKQNTMHVRPSWAVVAMSAIMALFCARAVFAENAYLAVVDPSPDNNSFTNCVNWRVGSASGPALGTAEEPIKSGYDYIVNGKTLRTPKSSASFGGDSLTIGSGGILAICAGTKGLQYTFPGNGVILRDGGQFVSWWGGSPTIKGKVTVLGGTVIEMYDNTSSSVLSFDCDFVGESNSSLWVYGYINNGKNTYSTVCFKGEALKNYAGTIDCSTRNYNQRNSTPNADRASTIKIGNVISPAKVTIHAYCKLTAETSSDVASIDTLVMKTNSVITVVYDKSAKTASCIKVRNTFTHNEGPVKIEFEPNPTFGDWPDSEIVPELEVLKAPEGVTLSTNDFVLSTSAYFPVYDLYVRTTEDGLSTLCIKQHGKVIKQQTADAYDDTRSSFIFGDHWSDGNPPDRDNCYYSYNIEQRAYTNEFPGRVLARSGGSLRLQKKETTIDDFRIIDSGSTRKMYLTNFNGGDVVLYGHIHLQRSDDILSICGHGSKALTIASEIDGKSRMLIEWTNGGGSDIKTVKLVATNDFYTGWISSECTGASDTKHCVLAFADGRSLGGAMTSWTYHGHTLNAYLHLKPLASTTLDRENCGILVDNAARIVCDDGITLTVKERTTWKGQLKKLGTGTLAWGGAAPTFITSSGTTPVAGSNDFVIAEGTLRPASSEAFRGVAVTIAAGAGIGVEVQVDATSDLAMYGMDLRPAGSSLTIEAASLTPEFSIPAGARGTLTAAICTVPAASAPTLRSKLCTPNMLSQGFSVELFERTNEDTSITFGIKAKRLATIIMVY